jgi:hypothetical protein
MATLRRSSKLVALGCLAGAIACGSDPTDASAVAQADTLGTTALSSGSGVAPAPAPPPGYTSANAYVLRGGVLRIQYRSIENTRELVYQSPTLEQTFTGDQIAVTRTPAGLMVSVVLRRGIHVPTTEFSLFVPRVNLGSEAMLAVEAPAILSTHGYWDDQGKLEAGQLDGYWPITLNGQAWAIAPAPKPWPGPGPGGPGFEE